ncbi:hypothetical protein [Erwinia phage Virsaitis27]|nr:hypothetical protein [Erwinia phage Virsaitis27]
METKINQSVDMFGNPIPYQIEPLSKEVETKFKALLRNMMTDSFVKKGFNPFFTSFELKKMVDETQHELSRSIGARFNEMQYYGIKVDPNWEADRNKLVEN